MIIDRKLHHLTKYVNPFREDPITLKINRSKNTREIILDLTETFSCSL